MIEVWGIITAIAGFIWGVVSVVAIGLFAIVVIVIFAVFFLAMFYRREITALASGKDASLPAQTDADFNKKLKAAIDSGALDGSLFKAEMRNEKRRGQ